MTTLKLSTPRRSVNLSDLPAGYRCHARLPWRTHLEVRQRYEAAHMVIGISEGLPIELYPRVREELAVLSPDADPDQRAADASSFQHARKRDGPDEALRSEQSKPRSTIYRKR